MRKKVAKSLDEASMDAKAIQQMAKMNNFTLEDAYAIQGFLIDERLHRGEKVIGFKLGFTSHAKMKQMNVHDLIWGVLTDAMEIPNGGSMELSKFIHPRAEPEIAFHVAKDFDKILTMDTVHQYVDKSAAAVEIIDSRYENFQFTLEDVVADNCSSSAFVVGEWKKIPENIDNLAMKMYFNGAPVQEGNSYEILENPIQSVIELSRLAQEAQVAIKKGQIILAGAATQAEFLESQMQVMVTVDELGGVTFEID